MSTTEELLEKIQAEERVVMARANPQWTARFAERRTDEAKVRTQMLRLYGSARRAFGSTTELAQLGRRLWQRIGEGKEDELRLALASELKDRLEASDIDEQISDTGRVFVSVAARSQNSVVAVLLEDVEPVIKQEARIRWDPAEVVFPEELEAVFGEVTQALSSSVADAYTGDVARQIVLATDPRNPLSIPQVAKQITNEAVGIGRKRAVLIARTETARVYGSNALTAMKRNGIERRRWITASGSPDAQRTPVCPFCVTMASQGWTSVDEPITGDLTVGVRSPRLITASAEHPPYHPNCRCDIAADTEGWLPPIELLSVAL